MLSMIKSKKIEFIASSEEVFKYVCHPEPAVKSIPNWYKESFKFAHSNKLEFDDSFDLAAFTIKSCIPVLDSITMGYIQKTWTDIYIDVDGANIKYRWSNGPQILSSKPDYAKQKLSPPAGHIDVMFNWKRYWIPKTPKGYSTLIVHPMYHTDLPFTCLPGVIDSDRYFQKGDSPPFYIKEGFSGVIPKGTPMFQIIPFKRESWSSSLEYKKYIESIKSQDSQLNSKFFDRYKKMFWQKKSYK